MVSHLQCLILVFFIFFVLFMLLFFVLFMIVMLPFDAKRRGRYISCFTHQTVCTPDNIPECSCKASPAPSFIGTQSAPPQCHSRNAIHRALIRNSAVKNIHHAAGNIASI